MLFGRNYLPPENHVDFSATVLALYRVRPRCGAPQVARALQRPIPYIASTDMRSYDDFEEPKERASKRDRLPRTPPRRHAGEWAEELRSAPSKADRAALPIRKAIASEMQRVFRSIDDVQPGDALEFFESRRHLMNHVLLTDLLNRLSAASLNSFSDNGAELVSVSTQVLSELLSERVRPGPREITTAWRAVSSIGISDPEILDDLARRTKRILHAFDTIDFAFAIMGLVSVDQPSPVIRAVLTTACAVFQGQIPSASPDSLLSVLLALHRSSSTEPDLVRKINESLLEEGEGHCVRLESLPLRSMGTLVRCNAELRYENVELFSRVAEHFHRAFLDTPEGGRSLPGARGGGDFIWAAAVSGYAVPRTLLTALERHVYEEIASLSRPKQRLICSVVAVPALLVASKHPSEETIRRFHELESMDRSNTFETAFERHVATVLSADLGLSFQQEVSLGPFSLDFLIQLPGGRRVNLETDGDKHHLLWNIATNRSEMTYRGRNIVRDKVTQFFGIETIRVLGSEWEAAPNKVDYLNKRLFGG